MDLAPKTTSTTDPLGEPPTPSAHADVAAYREYADREIEIARNDAAYWKLHIAKLRLDLAAARRYCWWAHLALTQLEWSVTDSQDNRRCPACWGRYPDHIQSCRVGIFFTLAEGRFMADDEMASRIPRFRRRRSRGIAPLPVYRLIEQAVTAAIEAGCRQLCIERLATFDVRVVAATDDGVVEMCEVYDRSVVL